MISVLLTTASSDVPGYLQAVGALLYVLFVLFMMFALLVGFSRV